MAAPQRAERSKVCQTNRNKPRNAITREEEEGVLCPGVVPETYRAIKWFKSLWAWPAIGHIILIWSLLINCGVFYLHPPLVLSPDLNGNLKLLPCSIKLEQNLHFRKHWQSEKCREIRGQKCRGGQTKVSGSLAPSNKLLNVVVSVWYVCVRVCKVCVRVCHVCVPWLRVCFNMLRAFRRECKFTHTRAAELQLENFTQRRQIKVCVCIVYDVCAFFILCVYWLKSCQGKAMFWIN